MKTSGELQLRAARATRFAGWLAALGIASISIIHPMVSEQMFEKWLGMPQALLLFPLPLICAVFFIITDQHLKRMPHADDSGCWLPFVSAVVIFFTCFVGLAYSFYPYVVPNQMTIWEAASAPSSLMFIFTGAVFVVPAILGYTVFSYRVFWGKAKDLKYY